MTGIQAIRITVIVIALIAFAGLAKAEQWNCYEGRHSSEILVVVTADTTNNTGTVKVAGTSQNASYSVKGLNRRWDFGGSTKYAFIIEPDGDATYYEVHGPVRVANQYFYCKEVK